MKVDSLIHICSAHLCDSRGHAHLIKKRAKPLFFSYRYVVILFASLAVCWGLVKTTIRLPCMRLENTHKTFVLYPQYVTKILFSLPANDTVKQSVFCDYKCACGCFCRFQFIYFIDKWLTTKQHKTKRKK